MRNKEDITIKELLDEEYIPQMQKNREKIREKAGKNIIKLQEENRRNYNKSENQPTNNVR